MTCSTESDAVHAWTGVRPTGLPLWPDIHTEATEQFFPDRDELLPDMAYLPDHEDACADNSFEIHHTGSA